MSKLNISFPARREPAGTVEIGVTINGREYFAYMAPGACNLRTFYGLNNINKAKGVSSDDICGEILAAIVLSGVGGSIMVFTDAYGRGADALVLQKFVAAQEDLVKGGCSVTVANGAGNPYMGGGKVVAAVLDYQMPVLKAWYDKTFGKAEEDGFGGFQRTNMDWLFYQYGGRPHAATAGDKEAHAALNASLDASRKTLKAKSA